MASGKTEDDIFWADMYSGNLELWSTPCSKITVSGETDIVNSLPSETYIVADSGTTIALIPSSDYENLLKIYVKLGITCVEQIPSTTNPSGFAKCSFNENV